MTKSAILKLETDNGIITGHDDCSSFLLEQAAADMEMDINLNKTCQRDLLEYVDVTVTAEDNVSLLSPPDLEEVNRIVSASNHSAAPGCDGIGSKLYSCLCIFISVCCRKKQKDPPRYQYGEGCDL